MTSSNSSLSAPEKLIALLEYIVPHLLLTPRRGPFTSYQHTLTRESASCKAHSGPTGNTTDLPCICEATRQFDKYPIVSRRSRRSRLSSPGELPFTAASQPCFQLQRTLGTCGRQTSSIAPTALLHLSPFTFSEEATNPPKRWPPQ